MVHLSRKTLTQLEKSNWGPPSYPSYLVRTCHALRDKPIGDFSVEDLRIMIGQKIGLKYLLPMAMEKLMIDPLAAGDFYPGDLLQTVMKLGPAFWRDNYRARQSAREVAAVARAKIESLRAPEDEWVLLPDGALSVREANELLEFVAVFERDSAGLK